MITDKITKLYQNYKNKQVVDNEEIIKFKKEKLRHELIKSYTDEDIKQFNSILKKEKAYDIGRDYDEFDIKLLKFRERGEIFDREEFTEWYNYFKNKELVLKSQKLYQKLITPWTEEERTIKNNELILNHSEFILPPVNEKYEKLCILYIHINSFTKEQVLDIRHELDELDKDIDLRLTK